MIKKQQVRVPEWSTVYWSTSNIACRRSVFFALVLGAWPCNASCVTIRTKTYLAICHVFDTHVYKRISV
jgi:hypothetical protein